MQRLPHLSTQRADFRLAKGVPTTYLRGVPRVRRRWVLWSVAALFAILSLGCVAALWPRSEHEALIAEVAGRAGVEAALVKAIVWRVSGGDAGKIDGGGYGLMQLGRGVGMEWAGAHVG